MTLDHRAARIDSPYAWFRLASSLLLSTIACIGMWSAVVALPPVQSEFAIDRASASLPFTFVFAGFAFGGALMGRLADRFGIVVPVTIGTLLLGVGYVGSAYSTSPWQYTIAYGVIGVGSSAAFAPLMADISHWFTRRRGMAVSIMSCGSYTAGTVWPPIVEYAIATVGWRQTHALIGALAVATMLPLIFFSLRPRVPITHAETFSSACASAEGVFGLSPNALQAVLMVAGIFCCVTMATPQVQIVAYCGDLGYGSARGAQMLSLMWRWGRQSRVIRSGRGPARWPDDFNDPLRTAEHRDNSLYSV